MVRGSKIAAECGCDILMGTVTGRPSVLEGSIDTLSRLDEVRRSGARDFTIGGAFFAYRFGRDFSAQIEAVCAHMDAATSAV